MPCTIFTRYKASNRSAVMGRQHAFRNALQILRHNGPPIHSRVSEICTDGLQGLTFWSEKKVIGEEWSKFAELSGELFPERCIFLSKPKVFPHRFDMINIRLQVVNVATQWLRQRP